MLDIRPEDAYVVTLHIAFGATSARAEVYNTVTEEHHMIVARQMDGYVETLEYLFSEILVIVGQ